MRQDIAGLFAEREPDRYELHSRHLNEQMVRVLRTIGYDVGFCKGQGQDLYDRAGSRYLDLLSGFGVFAIGRNHPAVRDALKSALDADLPNLVVAPREIGLAACTLKRHIGRARRAVSRIWWRVAHKIFINARMRI